MNLSSVGNASMRWLLGIVAVTAVVVGVWWFSAGQVSAQENAEDTPGSDAEVMTAALSISAHASSLFMEHSVETGVTWRPDSAVHAAVASRKAELERHLATLRGKGYDDRVDRIEALVNRLASTTDEILAGRPGLYRVLLQTFQIRDNVLAQGYGLIQASNSSADGNFYGLIDNQYRLSFRRTNLELSSIEDARRQAHLDLMRESALATSVLVGMSTTLSDPLAAGIVEDTYITAANHLRHSTQYLEENPGPYLDPELISLANVPLDTGDEAFSDMLGQRRPLIATEKGQIADNRQTLNLLLAEVHALVAVVQGQTPQPVPTLEQLHRVPGISGDMVLFGQSAAHSGPSARLGLGMTAGIEAAFQEANEDGGVHGRQLQLVTRDDRYESQWSFRNTLALIGLDRVFGLIGAVGTPTSMSASPVAATEGVPFIGPFTGANFLRDSELDYVVNYRASYYQETEEMVERLTEDLGITRVAVLYQSDSYGADGLEGVRLALARRDLEPVASGYYTRNTSAVKRAAVQIAEANPEAVIIIGSYAPAAAAIEMLRDELHPDPVFMAVSFVGSEALADALGRSGAGVYVTQVTPLPDDRGSQVVRNYRAALSAYDPDAVPGFTSLEGCLAGRLAIAGLELCGRDLSRECFLDALRDAGSVDIDDIALQYGPGDNQGSDRVRLTILGADGNYREVNRLQP